MFAMPPIIVSFLHWAVTILVCGAFVSCLAVRNTPDIREPPVLSMARNIRVGAWLILSVRMVFIMAHTGSLPLAAVSVLAIAMLALGTLVACLARLNVAGTTVPCSECPFRGDGSWPIPFRDTVEERSYDDN